MLEMMLFWAKKEMGSLEGKMMVIGNELMKMKIKISETGGRVWGGSALEGQVFGGWVMFRWGFYLFFG